MQWRDVNKQQPYQGSSDCFDTLGVAQNCSKEELKRAYHEKVKAFHPDITDPFLRKQGEEMMKAINEAYRKVKVRLGYE